MKSPPDQDAPRPSRRYKAFTVALLSSVLALAAAVVLGEVILSREGPARIPFHNELYPYVMFRPPANVTWESEGPSLSSRTGERAIEYTNKDGFRIQSPDHPLTKNKPEGQIRIAVLGGSTVRIGTRFEVSLPGALKRLLSERFPGRDIEVINAGIISAISRQELVFLVTTLLDYDLDILVVYDGINDSGQMLYFERRPNFPYIFNALDSAWRNYLGEHQQSVWSLIAERSAILQAFWPRRFAPQVVDPLPADDLIESADLRRLYAEAHKTNWRRMAKICRAYGIEPFFVLQPTSLYALFPEDLADDSDPVLYANYLVYEELRGFAQGLAAEEQVNFRDMSNLLLDQTLFYDGAHVYDDVNHRIATELVDFINSSVAVRLER